LNSIITKPDVPKHVISWSPELAVAFVATAAILPAEPS